MKAGPTTPRELKSFPDRVHLISHAMGAREEMTAKKTHSNEAGTEDRHFPCRSRLHR